ncbi:unnamed protein product [Moneuplotes crassus]|uniref:Uncharacterized protein n=1 Tax=Euplotes crassus TaxID=5936 RepID=A0AAD1XFD8_EUPCR|nr:unnamed protein product [Moneuplotes crassus]
MILCLSFFLITLFSSFSLSATSWSSSSSSLYLATSYIFFFMSFFSAMYLSSISWNSSSLWLYSSTRPSISSFSLFSRSCSFLVWLSLNSLYSLSWFSMSALVLSMSFTSLFRRFTVSSSSSSSTSRSIPLKIPWFLNSLSFIFTFSNAFLSESMFLTLSMREWRLIPVTFLSSLSSSIWSFALSSSSCFDSSSACSLSICSFNSLKCSKVSPSKLFSSFCSSSSFSSLSTFFFLRLTTPWVFNFCSSPLSLLISILSSSRERTLALSIPPLSFLTIALSICSSSLIISRISSITVSLSPISFFMRSIIFARTLSCFWYFSFSSSSFSLLIDFIKDFVLRLCSSLILLISAITRLLFIGSAIRFKFEY